MSSICDVRTGTTGPLRVTETGLEEAVALAV
jgi:hypothetical protein